MIDINKITCPRCGAAKMKSWYELIEEQQMLADKLPMSAEYPVTQRKKHRFCTKCWFEETENTSTIA